MKADEAYRFAKLHRDINALDLILAAGFNETNQNGNSRDKAQTIELWKTFSIDSLTTDTHQVRIAGDTATVTGTQTEDGTERMLFTRTYVKSPGGWQLLASMQYRTPDPATSVGRPLRQDIGRLSGADMEVMKVEEEYRLAKLSRDINALNRIVAEEFYGTNQNGNSRDKAQLLELWRSFSIRSLTTDTYRVRITGDTAMVLGTQTEDGDGMLFTRVWVKRPIGWQLVASMQYRDPKQSTDSFRH